MYEVVVLLLVDDGGAVLVVALTEVVVTTAVVVVDGRVVVVVGRGRRADVAAAVELDAGAAAMPKMAALTKSAARPTRPRRICTTSPLVRCPRASLPRKGWSAGLLHTEETYGGS